MNATSVARFVVEPQPVHGYRVTGAEGPDASRLQRSALKLLDLLGQPSPNGPKVIHAWLGPVGPQGEFVRATIERLDGGEFRYRQAWFADKALPAHPARWSFDAGLVELPEPVEWPGDVTRVLDVARRAAESGSNEWITVPAAAEGLHYCHALTEVLGTPPANRLTWITHAPAAAVPVHLQFRADPGLLPITPQPSLPTGVARLRNVAPIPVPGSHGRNGRSSGGGHWGWLLIFLIVVFAGGAAAGWFGRDGLAGLSPAFAAGVPGVLPGVPMSPPPPSNPQSPHLSDQVAVSRELREKLPHLFAQENLSGRPGTEPSDKTTSVALNSDLDFGKYERKKMTEKEVRQLLDLLKALEDWQNAQPR